MRKQLISFAQITKFWVRDFSVWPIQSGRFGLADSVWEHFGQTMISCRNLTCSHFNANIPKSKRSFIWKNYKHDPRTNS